MSTSQERVGFIGLGAMGLPMAENLIRAGYEVHGYDIRPDVVDAMASRGGVRAASPAEVGAQCPVTLVIVLNEEQVEYALFGAPNGGVVGNAVAGATVVIHSTVSPAYMRSVATRAAERSVSVVDAPVTGSLKGAIDGTLSIIAGGADADLDRVAAIFDVLGSHTIRVGGVGFAQSAKLINNLLAAANSVAISEGLRLGAAVGLSAQAVLEVANNGTGASFMSTQRDLVLEMGQSSDLVGLGFKDLRLALEEGHIHDVPLPVTAVAQQFLADYHRR